MRRLLEEASDPAISAEEFQKLEVAFHRAIANAARNRLLNLPMQAIHIVRPRTNKLLHNFDRRPIIDQHARLCDEIDNGDPDAAEQAFAAHLDHLANMRKEAARSKGIDPHYVPLSDLSDSPASVSPDSQE